MAQYFDKLFSNTEFEIESTANALIMVFWFLRNLKRMLNHMNTKIIILRTIWIKMRWYRTEIREVIEFFGTHLKFRDLNITWNDGCEASWRRPLSETRECGYLNGHLATRNVPSLRWYYGSAISTYARAWVRCWSFSRI